jgi:hypothetical protein
MIRATGKRHDAVFIRKSGKAQDEEAQIGNVATMLAARGVEVPREHWYVCTVQRPHVQANADFVRLMKLVEAGKIATVYVESQDRFGTGNIKELFSLLLRLENHDTKLFDLRENVEITGNDDATDMRTFLGGLKSKKERSDISFRSLRTRVENFKERGSWPNGCQPFGFGKECRGEDGKLLWVWEPVSRTTGRTYDVDANGKLIKHALEVKAIRRKDRRDTTTLAPSLNKAHVKTVQLIFELFTRQGLSRRKISGHLNAHGHRYYDKPFSHSLVCQILANPAYVGDTHFGKTQGGELHTFDDKGMVKLDRPLTTRRRPLDEQIIKRNTHKGLIPRKVWEQAQAKLGDEQGRMSFAPRNPAYYLKQIFVCGHCGKGMVGRTELDPGTKTRRVVYFCSTYLTGRQAGREVPCGAHRITHDDAEQLLLAKIAEFGLQREEAASAAHDDATRRIAALGHESAASRDEWLGWVDAGVAALKTYLRKTCGLRAADVARLEMPARNLYRLGKVTSKAELPMAVADLRRAIKACEKAAVAEATAKLTTLRAEHARLTGMWMQASEMQQPMFKQRTDALEVEIKEWEPRVVPITQRLQALEVAEDTRAEERDRLIAEWPKMQAREKGEALRRLFKTVTLHWGREFIPASPNPTRPRKTDRPGRYRYTLLTDKIAYDYRDPDLASSY